MFWIIGIIVFLLFVWSMGETPEDRRIDERNRHEALQAQLDFDKTEFKRKKLPPLRL